MALSSITAAVRTINFMVSHLFRSPEEASGVRRVKKVKAVS
jgi:hypothetical protein